MNPDELERMSVEEIVAAMNVIMVDLEFQALDIVFDKQIEVNDPEINARVAVAEREAANLFKRLRG
ncbi:MAG TPA: hypothetical protein VFM18_17965 [Methanosarcina sp.]|nr:hypothetical protein [Methanosarcina sp.]